MINQKKNKQEYEYIVLKRIEEKLKIMRQIEKNKQL
jgi:hypothetical protein